MRAPLKPTKNKKCPDCGKRGNWRKTIAGDSCPECSAEKKQKHAQAQAAMEACSKRAAGGRRACHPSRPPMCDGCTAFFAKQDKS